MLFLISAETERCNSSLFYVYTSGHSCHVMTVLPCIYIVFLYLFIFLCFSRKLVESAQVHFFKIHSRFSTTNFSNPVCTSNSTRAFSAQSFPKKLGHTAEGDDLQDTETSYLMVNSTETTSDAETGKCYCFWKLHPRLEFDASNTFQKKLGQCMATKDWKSCE